MGVVAFEVDLPGYRFGWRQVASGVAAVAVVAGIIPVLGAAIDGRWSMPAGDDARALAFIDEENDETPFRVLWVGDPTALPLAGWELQPGVAYATTDQGSPTVENLWVGSDDGATGLLADALDLALEGQTARLGRLLAPMGVRYVVVPERLAPAPFSTVELPVPPEVSATLAAQLDLQPLDVPAGLTVFRNEAAMPPRTDLPVAVVPTEGGVESALGLDLSAAALALPDEDGHLQWSGPVEDDTDLVVSASSADRWTLTVDGESQPLVTPFGWSTGFEVTGAGTARLEYDTSSVRYGALALQVLAWVLVLRALLHRRLRARRADTEPSP
jgi:hypothetical protein